MSAGLEIVKGGRRAKNALEAVQIVTAPEASPPFPVDALLIEEDTARVLSADPTPRVVDEHPIRLMTAVYEFRPDTPGTVTVHGRHPYRLYAVVHDFDQDPPCREEWVRDAVCAAIGTCRELGVRSLGAQLIGCRFGPFEPEWFIALLEERLRKTPPGALERIWLITETRPES